MCYRACRLALSVTIEPQVHHESIYFYRGNFHPQEVFKFSRDSNDFSKNIDYRTSGTICSQETVKEDWSSLDHLTIIVLIDDGWCFRINLIFEFLVSIQLNLEDIKHTGVVHVGCGRIPSN